VPYADPSEQREFNRNLFFRRYNSDAEFREDEALRKKKWYDLNQTKISERKKIYYQKKLRQRKGVFFTPKALEPCLL
jgi:hypothetical protein